MRKNVESDIIVSILYTCSMYVINNTIQVANKEKTINLVCFTYYFSTVVYASQSYKDSVRRLAELLEEFARENNMILLSDSMNFENVSAFQKFLHPRYRDSSFAHYIYRLRTVLRAIASEGYIVDQTLCKMRVKKADNTKAVLDEKEIFQLYRCMYSDRLLKMARDIIIILCRVGLRYCDYLKVTSICVNDNILTVLTSKEKVLAMVPLHYLVRKIMKKYGDSFPQFPHSMITLNKYIKLACQKAGIIEETLVQYSKNNQVYTESYPKYELISTHTGRRSFATFLDNNEVPPHEAKLMTGHKSTESYLGYIQDQRSSVARKYNNSEIFNPETVVPEQSTRPYYTNITNEMLIQRLQDIYKNTGKPPISVKVPMNYVYSNRFGSWNKALKAAGIPCNRETLNKEQLIENLKNFYVKFHRLPIYSDTLSKKKTGLKDARVYFRNFDCDSWEDVLKVAGLVDNAYKAPAYFQEDLLQTLRDYYKMYNRSPRMHAHDEPKKKYTYKVYMQYLHCSTWNEVLALAGIPPCSTRSPRRGKKKALVCSEMLIASLREFTLKHKRPPLLSEASLSSENGLYQSHFYMSVLHCTEWSEVLRKAGVCK